MEETISLQEIFQTIKKRMSMIIIITILATLASGIVTHFFMSPKYDASTQILVNQSSQQNSPLDYSQVQTNVQLINTYTVIIESPSILKTVIKDLNLDMTVDQLSKLITVNSAQNSQVFTVTVESTSPNKSVELVNKIAYVFKSKIQKVMKVDNVSVLSKAELTASQIPVKPNLKLNLAIAFVVGLMISIGLAFLLDYLDNTIKTETDIEKYLELPVLGAIPDMGGDKKKKRHQSHTINQQVRGGNIGSQKY